MHISSSDWKRFREPFYIFIRYAICGSYTNSKNILYLTPPKLQIDHTEKKKTFIFKIDGRKIVLGSRAPACLENQLSNSWLFIWTRIIPSDADKKCSIISATKQVLRVLCVFIYISVGKLYLSVPTSFLGFFFIAFASSRRCCVTATN